MWWILGIVWYILGVGFSLKLFLDMDGKIMLGTLVLSLVWGLSGICVPIVLVILKFSSTSNMSDVWDIVIFRKKDRAKI
jgi:hypothetical protein